MSISDAGERSRAEGEEKCESGEPQFCLSAVNQRAGRRRAVAYLPRLWVAQGPYQPNLAGGGRPSGGVRLREDFFCHADCKAVAVFLTPAQFCYSETAIFVA